jgi:Gluconate 2-dehydrogenase subunit 3
MFSLLSDEPTPCTVRGLRRKSQGFIAQNDFVFEVTMAGTRHPTPRILRIMAMSGASHFPGFTTWCFATAHPGAGWQESKPAKYRPQFFSEREYALLERLTELIILSDETPGAKDAGVAEFVHFMVAHDPDKQYKFRTGITWLNAHSERLKTAVRGALPGTAGLDSRFARIQGEVPRGRRGLLDKSEPSPESWKTQQLALVKRAKNTES